MSRIDLTVAGLNLPDVNDKLGTLSDMLKHVSTAGTISESALPTLSTATGGTGIDSYTLGDTLYADTSRKLAKLAGNTTTTTKFLSQVGDGTNSAAPAWAQPAASSLSDYTAWTSFTPTRTSETGTWTLGTVVAYYMKLGKLMIVSLSVVSSTTSNATRYLQITIPSSATAAYTMSGCISWNDAYAYGSGQVQVTSGQTYIRAYPAPTSALSAFSASPIVDIDYTIAFAIQ